MLAHQKEEEVLSGYIYVHAFHIIGLGVIKHKQTLVLLKGMVPV